MEIANDRSKKVAIYKEKDNEGYEMLEVRPIPVVIIIDDDEGAEIGVENHDTSDYFVFSDADNENNDVSKSHGENQLESSQLSTCLHRRVRNGEKRPVQIVFNNVATSSSSSDCEIIEDLEGNFRREWEQAALRKQTGKSCIYQAVSEESTTITNLAGSSGIKKFQFKQKCQYQETSLDLQVISDPFLSSSCFQKGRDSVPVLYDQQDSNICSDTQSESSSYGADESEHVLHRRALHTSSPRNDTVSFSGGCSSCQLKSVAAKCNGEHLREDLLVGKSCVLPRHACDELHDQIFAAAEASFELKGSEDFQHVQDEEDIQQIPHEDDFCWQDSGSQWKSRKFEVVPKNGGKQKFKKCKTEFQFP